MSTPLGLWVRRGETDDLLLHLVSYLEMLGRQPGHFGGTTLCGQPYTASTLWGSPPAPATTCPDCCRVAGAPLPEDADQADLRTLGDGQVGPTALELAYDELRRWLATWLPPEEFSLDLGVFAVFATVKRQIELLRADRAEVRGVLGPVRDLLRDAGWPDRGDTVGGVQWLRHTADIAESLVVALSTAIEAAGTQIRQTTEPCPRCAHPLVRHNAGGCMAVHEGKECACGYARTRDYESDTTNRRDPYWPWAGAEVDPTRPGRAGG